MIVIFIPQGNQVVALFKESIALVEYAKEHKKLARTFETPQGDGDKIYLAWRQKSSVG
ncbi:MAG: hypothetical protein V3U57_10455 [Robiginitomaculum sp.]